MHERKYECEVVASGIKCEKKLRKSTEDLRAVKVRGACLLSNRSELRSLVGAPVLVSLGTVDVALLRAVLFQYFEACKYYK